MILIMRVLINSMKDLILSIIEEFGLPITLKRVISECPELRVPINEPERVIDCRSVVKWQDLAKDWPPESSGSLCGWAYSSGEYRNCKRYIPQLVELVNLREVETWQCDIQEVVGLSASKSNLSSFISLDIFVETESPELINLINEEGLVQNLTHVGLKLSQVSQLVVNDCFVQYQWDGRIFLMNTNGSHHFAAARYIASRLGVQVLISGKLKRYSFNLDVVDTLRRYFDIYSASHDPDVSERLDKALKAICCEYYWCSLPLPYSDARLILLPKSNKRSMHASDLLRRGNYFDAGKYIEELSLLN